MIGQISRLAPAGGTVWVTVQRCSASGNGCSVRLETAAADGSSAFTQLDEQQLLIGQPLVNAEAVESLARPDATHGFLLDGLSELHVTEDAGRAWVTLDTPCTNKKPGSLAAPSATELWLVCSDESRSEFLYLSTDAGHTWLSRGQIGYFAGLDSVVAVSSTTAWFWSKGVNRSSDSGRTLRAAPSAIGGADSVRGFTAHGADAAWAVSRNYASSTDNRFYVWRTTDGVHWSKSPLAAI
jgi:hypothetical protein